MQKVSIIMPAYNAEAFIAESIRSVLHQTYPFWELIVVDDGSTDNTAAIVKSFTVATDKIIYLYQPNGKQGKARNRGLCEASGELIAFLDADDVWLSDKLAIQVEQMQREQADFVFSNSYRFDEAGNLLPKQFRITGGRWHAPEMLKLLTEKNRIPILTALVKKEKIRLVNGFTEVPEVQNAEDYHLWVKLCFVNTVFAGVDLPLAKYRVHEGQVSRDRWEMKLKKILVFHDLSSDKSCWHACRQMILQYHLERPFTDHALVRRYFFGPQFFRLFVSFSWLRNTVRSYLVRTGVVHVGKKINSRISMGNVSKRATIRG